MSRSHPVGAKLVSIWTYLQVYSILFLSEYVSSFIFIFFLNKQYLFKFDLKVCDLQFIIILYFKSYSQVLYYLNQHNNDIFVGYIEEIL